MKKRMLSMLLAFVMVAGLLPGFSLTASAAEAAVKIGEYGLTTYGPSALDIVRDTTLNEDDTVSVTFRLKDDLSAEMFTQIILRFRYDTERMTLIKYSGGKVFTAWEAYKSGSLDYTPFSVHVMELTKPSYPAGEICTLTFSVRDETDTDLFGDSKPYWWVDLGGEDLSGHGNPVTVFTPDSDNCFMVSLYEGTRTGIPDEQPADIVWVGGQGMAASADGTVVSYYTNGLNDAVGTVSADEPDQWNAKLYYDAVNSAYTLEINDLDATGVADDETSLGAGIYSTVPLTIDMTGENHVTGDVYNYRAHGVYVAGALTFQGTGSLEAKAKDSLSNANSRSIGVYTTGLLSVNGGTLTAAAGQAKGISSGVFVYRFTMNGGTLSTSSASSQAGVSAAYSEGIYSGRAITINGGTICAESGYGSMASHGIMSESDITINNGTVSAAAGDSNEDQSRGIYASGVLTIKDGTVTGVAGSSKQDFSEGVGGANGVVILGGEVEAIGGDNSLVSIGLCSDADMTIGEDAVIRASAGSARKYSYGTFVMDDFHMSGEAFLQTHSDKTTDEPTNAKIPRSIGLYCGATSSTDPDDMDPYDEPATPVADDTFTITGGTLEAWCTTSEDSTSTENYAVKMFDVVGNNFTFSDANQENDQWYEWTLQADENGDPINKIKSTETKYVHADEKENYKSTYLYIAPMGDIHKVTFNSMGGSEVTPNPVEVEDGKTVTEPAEPTKEGFTFVGWFTSEDNGVTLSDEEYDFSTPVVNDFTLYAKWEKAAPPVVDPPVIDPPVVISGTASLTKVDAEDPTTVLPGVVFELRQSNGALIGTYTTNASGQITVYGLMPGTYYWRETRPAEGYVLDGTEHVVTVYAGQTSSLVVKNERSSVPGAFSSDHYAYIIGSDGLVRPEANITRAEVATIFFRLLNEETRAAYMTDENTFADVNEGDWFNTAASTMAAMGIMTGLPDGGFHPMQNITRAEFAAVAARFDPNGNAAGAPFTDISGHWAEAEINIAANNGWILGFDGKFRPDDLITRAEAMTLVNRVLRRIPGIVGDLLPDMVTWADNMDTSRWYYLAVQEATNSHDYGRYADGYEYWTGLRPAPDWAALEK